VKAGAKIAAVEGGEGNTVTLRTQNIKSQYSKKQE
jgi:hypothetical protein